MTKRVIVYARKQVVSHLEHEIGSYWMEKNFFLNL